MSKQVSEHFKTEYETRVQHVFQRGGKLLKTCRNKSPKGKVDIEMMVAGQGKATQRPAPQQEIPFMNAGRSKVKFTLEEWFAGDPVQWEDLESMEIDDRQTIADQAGKALAREVDDIIVKAVNDTTHVVGDGSTEFTYKMHRDVVQKAQELHWEEEPGSWYFLIGPNAWGHMMTYDQFIKADYIRDENLPLLNRQNTRMFEGITYIMHNGLVSPATNRERGLLYFGPTIAAAGEPAGSDWQWQGGQKQWWEVMDKVRAGAKKHLDDSSIACDYATNIAFKNAAHA